MIARRRFSARRRRGAALVEGALVLSTTFLLIIGLIVAGWGVFRSVQLASLAREGARYASVHGGQYQQDTGKPAATPEDVYNHLFIGYVNHAGHVNHPPLAVGFDLSKLTLPPDWVKWDDSSKMPVYYSYTNYTAGKPPWVTNNVTVKLTYQWIPEAYFGSSALTSTSVMPMSY